MLAIIHGCSRAVLLLLSPHYSSFPSVEHDVSFVFQGEAAEAGPLHCAVCADGASTATCELQQPGRGQDHPRQGQVSAPLISFTTYCLLGFDRG